MHTDIDPAVLDPNIIEVVYALPDYQHKFPVDIREFNKDIHTITIAEVIHASGILDYYQEIDLNQNRVGIFSELKNLSDTINQYDRVEIYRPLIIDPMQARRIRAEKQKLKQKEKITT